MPIKDLIDSQEIIDAEMIIDMEYTDWNQNVDINKIIQDMHNYHIPRLTQNAFEAIVIKIGVSEDKALKLRELYQTNTGLNVLLIAKDLQCPDATHFESLLTPNETPLVRSFRN